MSGAIYSDDHSRNGGPFKKPRQKVEYKTRRCLKCTRNFKSAGAHNRLCDKCGTANRNTVEDETYSVVR